MPNILGDLAKDEVNAEPLNDRFNDYGWTSTNFLLLAGRNLQIWILIAAFYPPVVFM